MHSMLHNGYSHEDDRYHVLGSEPDYRQAIYSVFALLERAVGVMGSCRSYIHYVVALACTVRHLTYDR